MEIQSWLITGWPRKYLNHIHTILRGRGIENISMVWLRREEWVKNEIMVMVSDHFSAASKFSVTYFSIPNSPNSFFPNHPLFHLKIVRFFFSAFLKIFLELPNLTISNLSYKIKTHLTTFVAAPIAIWYCLCSGVYSQFITTT